jgi:hypothetical protein
MHMEIKDPKFEKQTIEQVTYEAERSAQRCGRPVYVMRSGNFVSYSTMKVAGTEVLKVITPGSYKAKMETSKLYTPPAHTGAQTGFSMFPEKPRAPKPAPTERAGTVQSADVGEALTRVMRKD